MHRTYAAEAPQQLYIEIGSGDVSVTTADVDKVEIEVTGRHADDVVVEQHDNQVDVIAPRGVGFRTGSSRVKVGESGESGETDITLSGATSRKVSGAPAGRICSVGPCLYEKQVDHASYAVSVLTT